jgi:hypothetical protein
MEGFTMTEQQFRREVNYGAAMALAAELRARGLVTPEDYAYFDARFQQKHRPCIGHSSPIYDRANP